jgi:hypothetical protein
VPGWGVSRFLPIILDGFNMLHARSRQEHSLFGNLDFAVTNEDEPKSAVAASDNMPQLKPDQQPPLQCKQAIHLQAK